MRCLKEIESSSSCSMEVRLGFKGIRFLFEVVFFSVLYKAKCKGLGNSGSSDYEGKACTKSFTCFCLCVFLCVGWKSFLAVGYVY